MNLHAPGSKVHPRMNLQALSLILFPSLLFLSFKVSKVHPGMNLQALVLILFPFLLFLPFSAEAGCSKAGCCYCWDDGSVIEDTGRYRQLCNPGYKCECGYHSLNDSYFGVCSDNQPASVDGERPPLPPVPQPY